MKIRVVAVGPLKQRAARELTDEYFGRVKRYCAFEEIEIKASSKLERSIDKAVEGAQVVALDPAGKTLDSADFARRLERLASHGKGIVAFLIGGADGLPKANVNAAHERWSLSALTFPHRLARVVLAEQLYRAMTILRGEPYNK